MTSQLQSLQLQPAEAIWEHTLRQWSQTFYPQALGIRLTLLLRDVMPAATHPLLEAIEQQYRQPDDQRRWQIFEQAQTLGFSSPVGALALSQFWSHGSMSPDELPPVYPEPQLSEQMLHCVLVMTAAQLAETPADGVHQLMARSAMLEGV
ncbi:DUF6931 family protein [Serratia marcescens]|uniref:DUF6931 family protein n=1 Tax=Serratia marcescens TaxID=615 RepID=UPI0002B89ED8|nr:hypothetical protein [Serratia marcescens]EMF07043.1 hypothetical protein F518_04243 [Serratia marcescens VGH107]